MKIPMPHDRYQTVHEVADRLKINDATVRRWIKDGELRAIDIGKGWRIADADLVQFLHHHETRPRAEEDRPPVGDKPQDNTPPTDRE